MLTVGYLFRHLKWAKSTLGQLEVCLNPDMAKNKNSDLNTCRTLHVGHVWLFFWVIYIHVLCDVYIYIIKKLASYVEDIAWINTSMFLEVSSNLTMNQMQKRNTHFFSIIPKQLKKPKINNVNKTQDTTPNTILPPANHQPQSPLDTLPSSPTLRKQQC